MPSKLIRFSAYLFLYFLCSFAAGAPSADLPSNWRSLLTGDVYHKLVNRGDTAQRTVFEGDIKGESTGTRMMNAGSVLSRNAIIDRTLRWPGGVVPYEISESFAPSERQLIEEGLRDLMMKTCVRFVPNNGQTDYIRFVRRGLGCSSYVARTGGEQLIDLMPGCLNQIGEVQHEVMHALGFYHEQSRIDRDDYVTIVWSNVQTGAESQFEKYRSDNLDMPYDYDSVMHYGWNYFAKDSSKPTILPRNTREPKALGTRAIVSRIDVEKINRLYECPTSRTTPRRVPVTSPTTVRRTTPRTVAPSRRTTTTWAPRYPSTPSNTQSTSRWSHFKEEVKDWLREHLPRSN